MPACFSSTWTVGHYVRSTASKNSQLFINEISVSQVAALVVMVGTSVFVMCETPFDQAGVIPRFDHPGTRMAYPPRCRS